MTGTYSGGLARLPVQVAPRLGEGTDSFIRRLARANHLRPSYLHGFLCGPPFWFGKPRVERLADVTGRTITNLEQALFDVSTARLRYRTGPGRSASIQPDLYTQLQNAARDEGLTVQELATRHRIPRWLIRSALTSSRPLPRHLPARQTPVTRPIAPLIDSILHAGLGPREVWTALMDQHDTSVSYGTLNLYIAKRRRTAEWQSEHFRRLRNAAPGTPRSPAQCRCGFCRGD